MPHTQNPGSELRRVVGVRPDRRDEQPEPDDPRAHAREHDRPRADAVDDAAADERADRHEDRCRGEEQAGFDRRVAHALREEQRPRQPRAEADGGHHHGRGGRRPHRADAEQSRVEQRVAMARGPHDQQRQRDRQRRRAQRGPARSSTRATVLRRSRRRARRSRAIRVRRRSGRCAPSGSHPATRGTPDGPPGRSPRRAPRAPGTPGASWRPA